MRILIEIGGESKKCFNLGGGMAQMILFRWTT